MISSSLHYASRLLLKCLSEWYEFIFVLYEHGVNNICLCMIYKWGRLGQMGYGVGSVDNSEWSSWKKDIWK